MELSDLANLITSRRSIRNWQDKEVPEELLLQAIELATWAPSGGNQQNWRFYIIKNKTILKAIGDAVQASSDLISSWPEAKLLSSSAGGGQRRAGFFQAAPAAIAVAAAKYQSQVDLTLEAREKIDTQAAEMRQWRNIADSRIQSVASAIAHMLLVFHQMGLGAVWMTGPMQAKRDIEKLLKVPAHLDVIAFIPVGYPAETPVSRGRKPVGEVSEIIR
ncbi:MAG: nitroreductase family protein [Chloroflexi bacterium]|nr:nitroreductase family protein [Chloroflexota bacterium]